MINHSEINQVLISKYEKQLENGKDAQFIQDRINFLNNHSFFGDYRTINHFNGYKSGTCGKLNDGHIKQMFSDNELLFLLEGYSLTKGEHTTEFKDVEITRYYATTDKNDVVYIDYSTDRLRTKNKSLELSIA